MPKGVPILPETFKNFISLFIKSLLVNNDGKAVDEEGEEDINETDDDDKGDEVVDEIEDADAAEMGLLPTPLLLWVKLFAAAGWFLPLTADDGGGGGGGPSVLARNEFSFSSNAEPLRLGIRKLGMAVVGWGAPAWLGSISRVFL